MASLWPSVARCAASAAAAGSMMVRSSVVSAKIRRIRGWSRLVPVDDVAVEQVPVSTGVTRVP